MTVRPPFPEVQHTVGTPAISRYAELSGDHNPLHVDAAYAAAGPFGTIVAHGPIGLQTVFAAVARWLGVDGLPPGVTVDVAYRGPVRAGDTVTCHVDDVVEHAARVVVLVRCSAGDAPVLEAIVAVPRAVAPRAA